MSLSQLGLGSSEAERLASTAALRQYPIRGTLSRISQMRHLVEVGALSASDARAILEEQPEYLQCEYASTKAADGRIIVIDKPFHTRLTTAQSSSLPRNRAGPRFEGEATLQAYLREAHPEALTSVGDARLCHNLDYATSGLIVAATSRQTARAVTRCFQARTAHKLYAALVHGHPTWERTTWCEPIDVSPYRFKQNVAAHGAGKPACTEVTVAARGVLRLSSLDRGRPASLLWLKPLTGRRHQLRVHCAHHGHPIVGDVSYGDGGGHLTYRTFLHAAGLQLPLSASNVVTSVAPLSPASWGNAIELHEEIRGPSQGDANGFWADWTTLLLPHEVDGAIGNGIAGMANGSGRRVLSRV